MTKPEPKIRVVGAAPTQFAENLDGLIRLVGLNRKDAAEAMGVTYKLVRRLVSGGLRRPDYRSHEYLDKVVSFFALPSVASLWRSDLVETLLTTNDGRPFVARFRGQLQSRYEEERSKASGGDDELVDWLEIALHKVVRLKPSRPPMSYEEKARAILASNSEQASAYRVLTDLLYADLERKRTGTC